MIKRIFFTILLLAPVLFCFSQTISGNTGFCPGSGTLLSVTGAPTPATYQWQRSTDGINWTSVSTSATYSATTVASYRVLVNGTATAPVDIVQNPKPMAAFTTPPNGLCSNVPLTFTDGSFGSNLTYLWSFGDVNSQSNNTSTNQNPTHTFIGNSGNNTQSFTVKLVVTSDAGCKDSITQSVSTKQLPNTRLNGTGATIYDGKSYFTQCNPNPSNFSFTNGSTTANSSYKIIWGDNTSDYSSTTFSTLVHTYNVGTSPIQFIVNGNNACIDTGRYFVFVGNNPTGGISSPGSTAGCTGETFNFPFTNISNNPPGTEYRIFINDGTPDTIKYTQANVPAVFSHTFNNSSCGVSANNSFTISFSFINPCSETPGQIGGIRISKKSVAAFTISPKDTVCQNTPVTFTISGSAGTIVPNSGNAPCTAGKAVWQISPSTGWSVASGSLGSDNANSDVDLWTAGTSPLRINFLLPGTYTIKLKTGTNRCGLDSITKTICVNPTPTGTLQITSPTTGCAPFTVNTATTLNTANCGVNRFSWGVTYTSTNGCSPTTGNYNFLNGTNRFSAQPVFELLDPGTYIIRDTIYSPGNTCFVVLSSPPIIVKGKPRITSSIAATVCQGISINPTASATCNQGNVFTYAWSFPGGNPTSATTAIPGPVTYAAAGNYTISLAVTNECGITTVTQPLVVGAIPDLTVPPDVTLCAGTPSGALTFSSTTTGVTYSWTNSNTAIGLGSSGSSATIPSFTATNSSVLPISSTITVTARTSGGCTTQKTFVIFVNPRPIIANQTANICSGSAFTVTPPATNLPAGTTYSWAAPVVTGGITGGTAKADQTSISETLINPTNAPQTATYTVTPKSGAAGNCIGSNFTVTVTVNPINTITGTATDPTSCTANNGIISLAGLRANTAYSVSYVRNSGSPTPVNLTSNAGGVITINNLPPGTYTNITASAGGCASNAVGPFNLVSPAAPIAPTAGSNAPLCTGSTLNLTASGAPAGAVYNWTGPGGFTSTQQNPVRTAITTAMAGSYSVTVTSNGCISAPATINVIINATPPNPVVNSTLTYCQNETAVALTATAATGNTLNWYTTATGGTASSAAPTPLTSTIGATTYYVSQTSTTSPACESGRAAITVNVRAVPVITGTATDPTSCSSTDGTIRLAGLTANSVYTISYVKNSGTPTTVSLTANASGVVTISNISSGTYSTITATASGCASNAVGPFNLVSPAAPGTPTATSNSPLCAGGTLNLSAGNGPAGAVYNWTGPGGFTSAQQIPVRPTVTTAMAGSYSVTITSNGCTTAAATVNVVVNATPANPIVTSPLSYCQNETALALTATATTGNTLNWYTTATGGTAALTAPVPVTTVVGATTYYVSQTSATIPACEGARAAILVNVKAVPVITGTATDPTSCSSTDGTIRISGLTTNTTYNVDYVRNAGAPTSVSLAANSSGVIVISSLSAGTYTNIVATLNSCASNAVGPLNLVSPAAPGTPTATNNGPLCAGTTLNITANSSSAGAVFNWTGPNGFTSTQQNPVLTPITTAMAGTYSVTVTSNGCTTLPATVNVVVNSAGVVTATSNSPVCVGSTINLISSSTVLNVTYAWTGPDNFSSTLQNPSITNSTTAMAGVYTVTGTSAQGGCTSTQTTTVIVSPIPNITAATFTDPVVCTAGTGLIILKGLTPNINYSVQYKKDGAAITANSRADADGSITIPGLSGGVYTNITVSLSGCPSNEVGPFTLINTNASPATPRASGNSPLCVGATLNLSAVPGSTGSVVYEWSGPNGFTSNLQNPSLLNVTTAAAGKYYVLAKFNNCSSARDSVTISIGEYPVVNLGPDLLLTPGTRQQITPTILNGPIANYLWTPVTYLSCSTCANPVATVQSNITYTLRAINDFGCSGSDTLSIKVSCEKSQVFIPDAFTPDGDGINDVLFIRSAGNVTIKYFRIFNKWGQLVFEKNNFRPNAINDGWNGSINGKAGQPDVFVYTAQVICENGSLFDYKGNISLLK